MKKQKNPPTPRVVYYRDALRDEFSTAVIEAKPIDAHYRYDRETGLRRILGGCLYRLVAVPLAWLYLKCKFRHKVVGKDKLKALKNSGAFLFGNHTQIIGDALIPSFLRPPHKPSVIVHPNNVSMPVLGRATPYLGALPLPDNMAATRNFTRVLEKRIRQNRLVVIYPEAHIWPYCTEIRPFTADSFLYPVKYDVPVYCFTNTYKQRKNPEKPQIVTYIDGPFYPDPALPLRERRKELRDRVHAAMTERAKRSDCTVVEYRKAPENGEENPEETV